MSIRMRSTLGAIVTGVGLLVIFTGMMIGRWGPFAVGGALTLIGLVLIVQAVRQASRDIGAAQSRFESQLRGELQMRREQEPPK